MLNVLHTTLTVLNSYIYIMMIIGDILAAVLFLILPFKIANAQRAEGKHTKCFMKSLLVTLDSV